MLTFVDGDRAFLDNAGANAVGALRCLRPHAAEPRSPIFELIRPPILATMFDCDTGAIAEQNDVSRLTNHPVELIDLLLTAEYQLVQRPAKIFQLILRQDA